MIGSHFIKSWSRTQKCVTLSSGEAELVAMTKVTAEAIGLQALLLDWGVKVSAKIHADSTAALAIANRKGSGKLRHINVGMLWLQEKRAQDIVDYLKIEGAENPADLMTKHVSPAIMQKMCFKVNGVFRAGRAEQSLHVSKGC